MVEKITIDHHWIFKKVDIEWNRLQVYFLSRLTMYSSPIIWEEKAKKRFPVNVIGKRGQAFYTPVRKSFLQPCALLNASCHLITTKRQKSRVFCRDDTAVMAKFEKELPLWEIALVRVCYRNRTPKRKDSNQDSKYHFKHNSWHAYCLR